jgi:GntR family transcriptional regulator
VTTVPTPAYRMIYDAICARIGAGDYPIGATIPRELDLAADFGVSRNTVRGALAMLENDGLIRRLRNAGTTVVATSRSIKIDFSLSNTAGIRNLVRATRFVLLQQGRRALPEDAATRANCPAAMRWRFVRGIRVDRTEGQPVGLNEIYIRPDLEDVLDGADMTRELVWPRFTALNKPVRLMWIALKPIVLTKTLASTLQARQGNPAMQLTEILRTDSGDVIEVINSIYLARYFDFAIEIGVNGDVAG